MRFVSAPAPACGLPPRSSRWACGVASVDKVLGGGLAYGRIHEVHAAEADDAGAAAGFAMAAASGMAIAAATNASGGAAKRGVLWLRSRRAVRQSGRLQASGWAELGGAPGAGLVGVLPDALALLRAAVDALRCPGLGAVIVEDRGRMPELDLTASRRLALAAERSGVPLFLLRTDAPAMPSAAQTRWQVASAPSRALPGHAPGLPAFDVTLLRQRSGPAGLDWRLEWDRDRCMFHDPALSGAMVSVPASRPAAAGNGTESRASDRHAA